MADHGQITDRLIAYHEARARGGAGLIVVQVAGVHETARYTSHVLMATDDSCIPGYRALAAAVKPHGTALFGQLFHPGREVMDLADGTLTVAVAPSAVPTERFRVMPRPLRLGRNPRDHRRLRPGRRPAPAGRPGRRRDRRQPRLPPVAVPQPGDQPARRRVRRHARDRLRFLREALDSIRRHCGPGFVAGLRISLDERDPAGLPTDIAFAASVALAEEGLADYLSVITGTSASLAGSTTSPPT